MIWNQNKRNITELGLAVRRVSWVICWLIVGHVVSITRFSYKKEFWHWTEWIQVPFNCDILCDCVISGNSDAKCWEKCIVVGKKLLESWFSYQQWVLHQDEIFVWVSEAPQGEHLLCQVSNCPLKHLGFSFFALVLLHTRQVHILPYQIWLRWGNL